MNQHHLSCIRFLQARLADCDRHITINQSLPQPYQWTKQALNFWNGRIEWYKDEIKRHYNQLDFTV